MSLGWWGGCLEGVLVSVCDGIITLLTPFFDLKISFNKYRTIMRNTFILSLSIKIFNYEKIMSFLLEFWGDIQNNFLAIALMIQEKFRLEFKTTQNVYCRVTIYRTGISSCFLKLEVEHVQYPHIFIKQI